MSQADLEKVKKDFVYTAQQAQAMGIEALELHAAHGYLLHQFLSPLSNQRTDTYGGSFENRIRFVMEVFNDVRQVFKGTLGIRISGTDWVDGGWTIDETCELAKHVKQAGAQFVHISSGGVSPLQKIYARPRVPSALGQSRQRAFGPDQLCRGLITEPAQAKAVLQRGDAYLVALARSFMYKPRWGWEAAVALNGTVSAQHQYWRSLSREAKNIFEGASIGMR